MPAMRRKIIFITIGILIAFGAIYFIKQNPIKKTPRAEAEKQNLSEKEEKKLIEENSKKYQPQKSDKTTEAGLDISAISAIVVDENTNEIIYQKSPNEKRPPASITKIATISVALENIKKDDLVEISQKAADQEPNKIVMKAGEKLKLDDLLYGLMMISANDAAIAIAEKVPGGFDKFIDLMNHKVKMLGLSGTHFKNPSGLDDPDHYSTAFDIATLTRYALLNHPEVIDYAGKKTEHSVYPNENNESHWWKHISHMLYAYPGMIAAKTGYTEEAKSTYIGVAERNGRRLVIVIMGATDANGDVRSLLDYGFAH
jgi:D-alanyl-D-alanine carboxypeptidase